MEGNVEDSEVKASVIRNPKIETLGDFRRITEGLSDDFKLDITIMKKLPEEELNPAYPYPWETVNGDLEYEDIGWSDKKLCFGIYEKGTDE